MTLTLGSGLGVVVRKPGQCISMESGGGGGGGKIKAMG